jgi:hypothetical protein
MQEKLNLPPIIQDYINNMNNSTISFVARQNYRDLLVSIARDITKSVNVFNNQPVPKNTKKPSIRAIHYD